MTLVAVPTFILGYYGQKLSEEDRDGLYFSVLSIANVGFGPDVLPQALRNGTINADAEPLLQIPVAGGMTEKQMAMWITYSVVLNAVVFIIAVAFFPAFVEYQTSQADESHITAADYAVFVRGLPSDTTEAELLDHFNGLYDLWKDDWVSSSCCASKRTRRLKYQPDTVTNRRRWANSHATAQHHRDGFKRNTADPVTSTDHVIDSRLDAGSADPDGWRRGEIDAALGAAAPPNDDEESGEESEESESASAAQRGKEGAQRLRELEADGFEDETSVAARKIGEQGAQERLRSSFPGHLGDKAARIFGGWVADVELVHPNGKLLTRYLKVRGILKQLDKETSKAKMMRSLGQTKQLDVQLAKLDDIEDRLRKINSAALSKWDEKTTIGAFVTFEHEESRTRALHDYDTHRGCCTGLAAPLRFRGKHQIEVIRAKEPDEIAWENMEVTDCQRCTRQCFTLLVAVVLLVVSLGVIISANVAKTTFTDSLPSTAVCSAGLPALHYGGYGRVPADFRLEQFSPNNCSAIAAERLQANQEGRASPGDGAFQTSETLVGIRYSPAPQLTITQAWVSAAGDPRCVSGGCFGGEDTYKCSTPASDASASVEFTGKSIVGCYCIQEFIEAIRTHGANGLTVVQEAEGELCIDLLSAYATSQSLIVGAALLVVVVNAVLKAVLTAITKFERHANRSDETASLAFKIFVAQFVNTALIVLLVNAQFAFIESLGLSDGLFGLFAGGFSSFVPQWYSAVGVGVCITMLSNVIVPHVSAITAVVLRPFKFCCKRPIDDEDMADLYALPQFDASSKYPIILNVVFVTMLYATGMPILYPIAAVFMLATYWIDRFCLMRCTARPAFEDAEVARQIGRLLPVAVFLHLAFGIWMLGDPETLKSDVFQLSAYASGTGEAQAALDRLAVEAGSWDIIGFVPRVVRANTFPVFAILVILIGFRITYALVGPSLIVLLRQILCIATCGLCCRSRRSAAETDEMLPPFSKEFAQQLQEGNVSLLLKLEREDTVELVDDAYRGKPFKVLRKRFSADDEAGDWRKPAGQLKRTWQVIAETHTPTYFVGAVPMYGDAYKAIAEGISFQAAAAGAEARAQEEEEEAQALLQSEVQEERLLAAGGAVGTDAQALVDDSAANGAWDKPGVVELAESGDGAGAATAAPFLESTTVEPFDAP